MNKKTIKVSAPCKVHLLGEHAVVYGKPALLAAVDKRCTVTITPREDNSIEVTSKNLNQTEVFTEDQVKSITEEARQKWNKFVKDNDIAALKSITENPLHYAVLAIGETLDYYKSAIPGGFSLEIDSQVPMGAGLGSSAVLGVTIAGAVTLFLGKDFDHAVINEIAYVIDQRKNGLPSGADNATACFGKVVWYRKETPEVKIIHPIPFTIPEALAKNFVIIDTGTPAESTGEMVGIVRTLYQENPEVVENFLNEQEKLTRELIAVVKDANETELMRIIKAGEKNLESIGVASGSSQHIIREIEDAGGAAKVCGAGGKTQATGVLLAYHKDKSVVEKIAQDHDLTFFSASLGVEGLRQEI